MNVRTDRSNWFTHLNGKYFRATDYTLSSTPDSYTIRVTLTAASEYWYELDEEGNESANYLLSGGEGGGGDR